jgi:hypothetical protein
MLIRYSTGYSRTRNPPLIRLTLNCFVASRRRVFAGARGGLVEIDLLAVRPKEFRQTARRLTGPTNSCSSFRIWI